jgi:hypothetical protein
MSPDRLTNANGSPNGEPFSNNPAAEWRPEALISLCFAGGAV